MEVVLIFMCFLLPLTAMWFCFSVLLFSNTFFFFFLASLLERFPALTILSWVANDMTKLQGISQPHNPCSDLPQMSWQLQLLPSVIGTGVHMPEALISRHDRDSRVEIALPFWSFCGCHFSSRFRNVARCCIAHPISAYAVPGWCLDRETIFRGYQM